MAFTRTDFLHITLCIVVDRQKTDMPALRGTPQQTVVWQAIFKAASQSTHRRPPITRFKQCFHFSECIASTFGIEPMSQQNNTFPLQNRFFHTINARCPGQNIGFATTAITCARSSSPTPRMAAAISISTDQFHRLSDAYIDAVVARLEEMQEEREDVDVEYSAGVLTLRFPPAGTYVLNKQPPNKQIWLSSPVSGPKRYDWIETEPFGKVGKWVYLRDGSTLNTLLAEEIGVKMEDV